MDAVLRGRIAAILLALTAVGLLFVHVGLAILTAATAVALFLTTTRGPAAYGVDLQSLLSNLKLQGPGFHVPTPDGVRLFVAADPRGPYLVPSMEGRGFHRDPPGSLGVSMPAPATALLDDWRQLQGWPSQGIEEGTRHVKSAMKRFALAQGISVARAQEQIRIQMRLRDAGQASQAQRTGWDRTGGCLESSLAVSLLALGMGVPLQTISSNLDADGTLTVEVVPCTTA